MERLRYILNLLIAVLLIATIAVNRDQRIFGTSVKDIAHKAQTEQAQNSFVEQQGDDLIFKSSAVVKNVYGYAGPTPLIVTVKDNLIQKVELGSNSETPAFLNSVLNTGILDSWNGLSLEEAINKSIDVVSGATLSSSSIIKTMQLTAVAATETNVDLHKAGLSLQEIIALLVIALGVAVNFIKHKKKWLKIVLFVLNVIVLGFWCGSFLSFSVFTAWTANGLASAALIPLVLFLVAIILPLFKRKGAYCAYHCPMGSAQELISLTNKKKIQIKPRLAKVLNRLRNIILAFMLFIMWCGVGFEIMDYEVFSAFLLESASDVVLIMALAFMILSIFIPRPYCRFVCPTGALLTLTQKTKNN